MAGGAGQRWLSVRGDLEAALALGPDAMQLHELAPPLFAHPGAPSQQLFPRARPAVAALGLRGDRLDMHQQRVVAEVAPLRRAGSLDDVFVVAGHAGLQHEALHRDGRPRRWRCMKAYFNSALSRNTPPLFPGCRTPSSRAPAPRAAG